MVTSTKKSFVAGFILGWAAGWTTPKVWISGLILVGFVAGASLPIVGCEKEYQANRAKQQAQEQAAAIQHWNGVIQPAYNTCLKKGGWPRYEREAAPAHWKVACDFPSK